MIPGTKVPRRRRFDSEATQVHIMMDGDTSSRARPDLEEGTEGSTR